MVPFLPKQIATRAIGVYLLSLVIVSIVYFQYAMGFLYIAFGILCVAGFFLYGSYLSEGWRILSERRFIQQAFTVAFSLRLVWIVFSYFYFTKVTGIPFEFDAADSIGYHTEAEWLASEQWSVVWDYYFGGGFQGVSDVGYPLYLMIVYRIFGPYVIIPRIIKALLGAYSCVLIYRLSVRTFGEEVGRMAGIMSALMPNLIIYCGYHLKETEMLFLVVAFLERMDYLLRSKRILFWNVFLPTLLAISLFFFRKRCFVFFYACDEKGNEKGRFDLLGDFGAFGRQWRNDNDGSGGFLGRQKRECH